MIELCNRRRMLAAIIVLVCVSIIIVLLENILTPDGSHSRRFAISSETAAPTNNLSSAAPSVVAASPAQKPCWEVQSFTVTRSCRPCLEFEKASGSIPECSHHEHVEALNCEKDGKVFRGCTDSSERAVRQFWLLELISLCTAVLSGGAVIIRQHQLEHGALVKIQRQLASQV